MSDVRKAFEEWAASFGWNVERRDVGDYQTTSTDIAWGGWKGCADSLLAQARADERGAVKRVIDGGSFLHDKAPPRLWANEVLAAIDRDAAIRARKDGQ